MQHCIYSMYLLLLHYQLHRIWTVVPYCNRNIISKKIKILKICSLEVYYVFKYVINIIWKIFKKLKQTICIFWTKQHNFSDKSIVLFGWIDLSYSRLEFILLQALQNIKELKELFFWQTATPFEHVNVSNSLHLSNTIYNSDNKNK